MFYRNYLFENASLNTLTNQTYVPDDIFDQITFGKVGSTVCMRFGRFTRAVDNSEGTISIGTIPEEYLPSFAANYIVLTTLSAIPMYVSANTSGNIQIRALGSIVSGASSYTNIIYLGAL